jgi:hypothetical protein
MGGSFSQKQEEAKADGLVAPSPVPRPYYQPRWKWKIDLIVKETASVLLAGNLMIKDLVPVVIGYVNEPTTEEEVYTAMIARSGFPKAPLMDIDSSWQRPFVHDVRICPSSNTGSFRHYVHAFRCAVADVFAGEVVYSTAVEESNYDEDPTSPVQIVRFYTDDETLSNPNPNPQPKKVRESMPPPRCFIMLQGHMSKDNVQRAIKFCQMHQTILFIL